MPDLDKINQIVGKLNMLEDSKEGQPFEKRLELEGRETPLLKQLHAYVGDLICPW